MTILDDIYGGKHDGELDSIVEAVKTRKGLILSQTPIKVKDRLRFVASVRPKYLAGQPVTVVGILPKNLSVRLDEPVGKYGVTPIRCPRSLLEPIPA